MGIANNFFVGLYQHKHFKYNSYSHYILGHHTQCKSLQLYASRVTTLMVEQVINYRTNIRLDSLTSQLVKAFLLTLPLDHLCTLIAVLCPAEISLLFCDWRILLTSMRYKLTVWECVSWGFLHISLSLSSGHSVYNGYICWSGTTAWWLQSTLISSPIIRKCRITILVILSVWRVSSPSQTLFPCSCCCTSHYYYSSVSWSYALVQVSV